LALATTTTGAPIGYHLFKGNTAEVSTLLVCLENWKTLFDIKDVIVVADRAMMSEDNLTAMEEAKLKFTYVVAAKLKKLPKKLREAILERKEESQVQFGEESVSVQEHDHEGRRLIVQYSEKRAQKDAKDRARLIDKIRKKLDESNKTSTRKLVTNSGYLKFLDEEKKGQAVLNERKIEEEKRWDGLHGVITNDKESKALDLLTRYRRLWVIEESFRINKHTLSMRPIYHFTPDRIKAHILICYLAFAITRYAQQKINIFDDSISIEKIRSSLAEIEASILEDKTTGHFYKVPSRIGKEAKLIYRAMSVQNPEGPSRYTLKQKM
jgi:transposase